jgi:MFS transporter, DHA3 family, macrolide efflux protein
VPQRTNHRRLNLLARSSSFRWLFLAALGSGVGTYLAAVALTVSIRDRTHSGVWVAALLVADFLPIVVIGLAFGPLIDRLSRRRVMIAADLARLGVFVLLPFAHRPGQIVALAAIAGIATGFFRPAVYAGLPNLVRDDDDLTVANSLLTGVENVAWMLGPVLAGGLLVISGPSLAYWINAVTFLVSALLIGRIPARRLQSQESLSRGHWRDVRDGISVVFATPQLRTVLLVWSVVIAGNAALNDAEVFFAKDSLDAGNIGYGVLVGATGVGLVVGSFLTPFVLGKIGLRRLYPGAIALMGIGAIAASTAPSIWVAAPLAALATSGNGAAIICNQLLVQRGAPDVMRGRAIAVLMSSTYLVLALAYAVAGPLTDAYGGRVLWAIAGGVYLCGAGTAFLRTRALRRALDSAPLVDRIEAATQV